MYASLLLPILFSYTTTVSATWTGIAIVGQQGHGGQTYVPDVGAFDKDDNFGAQTASSSMAGTACQCKFYTSGGNNTHYSDTMYESDPRSSSSRLLTHMTVARYAHSMTCTGNDTILICGGAKSDADNLNSCELCHLTHPICVPLVPMPVAVRNHAAVFRRGHLYVIGGYLHGAASSRLYDFSFLDLSWYQRKQLRTARAYQPGAILLNSGHILACGGGNNGPLKTCESYDPISDTWTMRTAMNKARRYFALVRFEGRVYAVGGYIEDDGHDTVEQYDEFYDTWTMEAIKLLPDYKYDAVGGIDHSCVA